MKTIPMPTDLNLFTLNYVMNGTYKGVCSTGKKEAANRIESVSVNGMRRCMNFGLVAATKTTLTLTELGENALCGWAFDRGLSKY